MDSPQGSIQIPIETDLHFQGLSVGAIRRYRHDIHLMNGCTEG